KKTASPGGFFRLQTNPAPISRQENHWKNVQLNELRSLAVQFLGKRRKYTKICIPKHFQKHLTGTYNLRLEFCHLTFGR
ncbi:TPA: hypothetical protein ACWL5C_004658, partial [Escherichia coli]